MLKYIHFFIFIGFCIASLQAQRPYYRPNVHEVSLQGLGLNYADSEIFESPSIRPFPIGVRYKYHFNGVESARGGIFYRINNMNEPTNPSVNLNMNYIEAKGGYERAYNLRKYQIFGGVDAIGGLRTIRSKDNESYFGGAVFFGVKRFFKENISLAVENDFYYLFLPKMGKEGVREGFYSETGSNFLQVYLSFHFKRQFKSCSCGKPGS